MIFKILFGVSIIVNGLMLFWVVDQKESAKRVDVYWQDRDHQRVKSIRFLSSFLVDELTKENLIDMMKTENRNYFEKEGQLVSEDITFLLDANNLNVRKIEPFDYSQK